VILLGRRSRALNLGKYLATAALHLSMITPKSAVSVPRSDYILKLDDGKAKRLESNLVTAVPQKVKSPAYGVRR
jgi:hypothetical protein